MSFTFQPERVDLKALDSISVDFTKPSIEGLPSCAGIYFVISASEEILYIGKSVNIARRWTNHSRRIEVIENAGARIAWMLISDKSLLSQIEMALLNWFDPVLSRHKNSLKNLKPRSTEKGKGSIQRTVSLHPDTDAIAILLGEGNRSKGIDRLFSQLPVFRQCKTLIETIAADTASPYSEQAEAILYGLEDLEIEQVYEEAIAEGVIKTESGAYIV